MSRCLFLEGPPQVGKSTLLLELLQPKAAAVGGFMVQRLWQDGQLKGFCLREVDGSLGPVNTDWQGDEPFVFLYEENGQWRSDPEVFARLAERLPQLAAGKKVLLLDEIGGVELLCDPFREQLYGLLDGDTPCVGVLKSAANSKMMRDNVEIADRYQVLYGELAERLSGQRLTVNLENRAAVRAQLAQFLDQQ